MNIYFELFTTFAKVACGTFGGGYAMLPMLKREVVNKKKWATEEEIMDYYAIGQCTPGIIAVNVSTFIGYKQKGVIGAIFSTLGMIAPSIIIILTLAAFISKLAKLEIVQHIFAGIRIAVCASVSVTLFNLLKKGICDVLTAIIAISVFLVAVFLSISPVWSVVIAATLGIIFKGKAGESK